MPAHCPKTPGPTALAGGLNSTFLSPVGVMSFYVHKSPIATVFGEF
jgi:hypothetical protein